MTIEQIKDAIYNAAMELKTTAMVKVDISDLNKLRLYTLELEADIDRLKKFNQMSKHRIESLESELEAERLAKPYEYKSLDEYI